MTVAAQGEARQRLYDKLNAVTSNSFGDVAMAVLLDDAEDVFLAAGYREHDLSGLRSGGGWWHKSEDE